MKHQFKSRKDTIKYLAEKGIDTSNWTEEKWLLINKGQAEIHMMALAEAMWDAYNESIPKELKAGEWHIPFGDDIDCEHCGGDTIYIDGDNNRLKCPMCIDGKSLDDDLKIKVATAMCARVSYTVVGEEGKKPNYENDIKLHDRLSASGHWSPFEHCAKTMSEEEYYSWVSGKGINNFDEEESPVYTNENMNGWSGNFRGFIQYRKTFNNENIR